MLQLRCKQIRGCDATRRETLSKETELLHMINTNDKSANPSYLHFWDIKCMYSPHHQLIIFVQVLDTSLKEEVVQTLLKSVVAILSW
jgi:hypothetical protein